jgi:hypothetical protein
MPLKYRYNTFFVALTEKCRQGATTWKRMYPNIGGSLQWRKFHEHLTRV